MSQDYSPQSPNTVETFDRVRFWQTFRHGTAVLHGVHLHYVEGGSGAPLLLLPGPLDLR